MIKRVIYMFLFGLNLIYNILKSCIETIYYIISGKIEPTVFDIESKLKKPVSLYLLANSITLTPGTLTVEIDLEHSILKVATLTKRDSKAVIPFEDYIKVMLE